MKNEKMQIFRNRIVLILIGCMMSVLLTACGEERELNHTELGMVAVEQLEYEEALGQFEKAFAEGEDERLINRGMGLAYMGLTKYGDAITYLEAALHGSNGHVENLDFDLNYYLALAYFKSGDADKAVATYDAILGIRPKEQDAYFLRGSVKVSQDRFEEAKADFDEAIRLDPQNYDQLIRIYEILLEYGYKDAGLLYLQDALSENEKSISDYDMGRICYYMENYEGARDYLTRLKTGTDYGAALYLGRTYEALGDYNYAASIYDGYTVNDQSKAEIYNQLGLCRMKMQEYELALSAFQTAMNIEDNGMMQSLKFNEIVTYEYMGEYKTAAALMSNYVRTYPDDTVAKREYEFLQTR